MMTKQTMPPSGYVNENKITQAELTQKQKITGFLGKYGLLGLALLTFVAFGVIEPYFARASNILDIFRTASIYGICALGLSLVMICGEIDFACGLEMAMAASPLRFCWTTRCLPAMRWAWWWCW